jgi:hypothetical protein
MVQVALSVVGPTPSWEAGSKVIRIQSKERENQEMSNWEFLVRILQVASGLLQCAPEEQERMGLALTVVE